MLDRYLDVPDDYYDHGNRCKTCEEHEQTLDCASNYLIEVVHQLYSLETLDKAKLESALDELCHLLQVRTNQGTLQIDRKRQPTMLADWISYNNESLYQIAK